MDSLHHSEDNAAALVELSRAVLDAPMEDRIILAWLLEKSVEAPGLQKDAPRLLEMMNELVGFDITARRRNAEYVRARVVFAFVAVHLGMNYTQVGRLLGVTWTNVIYYCDVMGNALTSPFFVDYVNLYKEFIKRLNNGKD